MTTRCRLSAVVLVPIVALAVARLVWPAESEKPAQPAGLILKYHQTEGDRASYDFSATGTAKLNVQKGLTTERLDVSMQMKVLEEFWEPTAEGLARVQGAILSGTVKAKSKTEEETQPIQRMAANYKIASGGEMREVELLSGEPPVLPGLFFTFGPDDAFLLGGLIQFPKKPLKAGDKWKGTARIPSAESDETVLVNYQCNVLGLEQYRGRPCVKIKTTAKFSDNETIPEPESGGTIAAKITATETNTWRFDYERGLVMSSKGTIRVSLAATFVDQDANVSTATITGVVNARSAMTEFNGQKLPAK